MISESKLDDSFLDGQFLLDGYSTTCRLDPNRNGGCMMFFVRDNIPSKMISTNKLPAF